MALKKMPKHEMKEMKESMEREMKEETPKMRAPKVMNIGKRIVKY
jgi:hypothetical protein